MSVKDAKYYISETREFVTYEELLNGQWFWKDSYFANYPFECIRDGATPEYTRCASEDLLKKSNTKYKQSSREIRFVDIGGYFDSMTADEWDDYKNGRIKIFNTMKSLSPEHT